MSVDERLRSELSAVHQAPRPDTAQALTQVRRRAARQTRHRVLGGAVALGVAAVAVVVVLGGWAGRLGAAPVPVAPAPEPLSEQDLNGDWVTPLVSTDTLVSSARGGENEAPHEAALRAVLGSDAPQRELALSVRYGTWSLAQRYLGGEWETIDRETLVSVDGDRVTIQPMGAPGSTVLRVVRSTGPAGAILSLEFVGTTEPDYEGVPVEEIVRALYTTFPFVAAPK